MENIKTNLNINLAKKIFGSQNNAVEYLIRLNESKPIPYLNFKIVRRGQNSGKKVLIVNTEDLWKAVVDTWDYENSKKIIRKMFTDSGKYRSGKVADTVMNKFINEWHSLQLGDVSWPFSQGAFDEFVQRVNSGKAAAVEKDEEVKIAAVKYRRIKEINTVRNDFIETLIFEKNENVLPTLNHRRGVDFFIDGISFDQKVAKSPTTEFKRHFGEGWKRMAIEKPELVSEYLYKYQDEGRFGADPRLLIVYIDEDVSINTIRDIISKADLNHPIEISFTYKHKNQGEKSYRVPCIVILLHN